METKNGESESARDVVDESPAYTLAGTDEGWGIWDRNSGSDQPVVLYPPTDDGFELAAGYFGRANAAAEIRRAPWMDVLRRAAFIAGGTWIATSAIVHLWYATKEDYPVDLPAFMRWTQALDSIGYSVFLVSVGAYVLFWLRGHQRP